MLAIIFTSKDDNELLIYNITRFQLNTIIAKNAKIYVFLENCSKSYINVIEHIKSTVFKNIFIEIRLFNESINNNILFNSITNFEYILNIKHDWLLLPDIDKNWLENCLLTMDNNSSISELLFYKKENILNENFNPSIKRKNTNIENTLNYEKDIFISYIYSIDYCLENNMGLIDSNFQNYFNVNCHIPVLVFHSNYIIDYNIFKNDFIRFLHFFITNKNNNESNIKKILSKFSPKCIVTIDTDNTIRNILSNMSFEIRKKWLHFDNYSSIKINYIENCIFNSFNHIYNKDNPIISVITPTYESQHRILRPLNSLSKQTYKNWEWIILDDSKTYKTWKDLLEFAENDERIHIYKRHENDGYIGNNKYFCASLAKGKLIFELDHDDDIPSHTFQTLIDAYKKYPDAGFFYSDYVECSEPDMFGRTIPFNYGNHFCFGFGSYYKQWHNNNFHYVSKSCPINPHTLRHIIGVPNHFRCWTKEAYISVGSHNTDLSVVDDYDLILRTLFKYKWCHIPEMLYIQYRNEGGNNFTFHRNMLIQYITSKLRNVYEENIHNRLLELKVNDDVYMKFPGSENDYKINYYKYPILEYKFYRKDQDDINPLISIVIPTYNREKNLKNALDSIFKQTYNNFEILLVGDNCPVLENFVINYEFSKDNRFKYFNLNENNGSGGAVPRNYALKMMCNSKWVAYLDDDNEWMPNHLESLVKCKNNNPDAMYVFSSMIIDGKKLLFDEPKLGRIDTSCVMHKHELCIKYGLWKNRIEAGYAHDWEFFSRWKNEKWAITKEFTLLYNTEYNGQTYDFLNHMYI